MKGGAQAVIGVSLRRKKRWKTESIEGTLERQFQKNTGFLRLHRRNIWLESVGTFEASRQEQDPQKIRRRGRAQLLETPLAERESCQAERGVLPGKMPPRSEGRSKRGKKDAG